MGVHTGTHVDGPLHFFDDGAGVDSLPLDAMLGRCASWSSSPRSGEAIDRGGPARRRRSPRGPSG